MFGFQAKLPNSIGYIHTIYRLLAMRALFSSKSDLSIRKISIGVNDSTKIVNQNIANEAFGKRYAKVRHS
jgi:hypothetical protein